MSEKKATDHTDRNGCSCWCATPYSVCPRTLSEGTSCRARSSSLSSQQKQS
jgi:hypothetical protein